MSANLPLDEMYQRWARTVKRHPLGVWALPLLDLLYALRGVALPLLWISEPFISPHVLAPLEETLAHPEALLRLRDYLGDDEEAA
ncbi:MAG: hypothetical protein ACP5HM_09895 [Anaerolineae bacterium]